MAIREWVFSLQISDLKLIGNPLQWVYKLWMIADELHEMYYFLYN